jgi:uncharacterized protein
MSKRLFTAATITAIVVVAVVSAAVVGAVGPAASTAGAATTTTSASAGTITVTGVGEVRGTPDVADLSIGVSGRGATAADALATVSDRAQKLLGVLRDAGVAAADIETSDLSIQPTTDGHDHITGYEAGNTVSAHIRDLSKVGGVVDAATKSVGDNIRLQGVTFSIDDDSALLAAARTQATKRARAQAEQLADGAGVTVGGVRSIEETSNSTPIRFSAPAADAVGSAATPVEAGTQTLSVSAIVVFSIR